MLPGCPSAERLSVRSSGQILLARYLMNGLSSLDITYSEYSLTPTGDPVRFWMSKVKVAASRQGGEGILVYAHIYTSTRPYLNYNLNFYVGLIILFIACCTWTFINTVVGIRSLRSVVLCVIVLSPCFIA